MLTTLTMDLLYSRVLDAASWNSAVINSTFHTCDMSKRLPRKGAICEDRRCDEGCRCCFRQESQPSSQPDLILGRGRERIAAEVQQYSGVSSCAISVVLRSRSGVFNLTFAH